MKYVNALDMKLNGFRHGEMEGKDSMRRLELIDEALLEFDTYLRGLGRNRASVTLAKWEEDGICGTADPVFPLLQSGALPGSCEPGHCLSE